VGRKEAQFNEGSTLALEPLPYYPWRVKDFRANRKVQRMGYLAKGFYRELLDEEWLEGSLPVDMASLADICGCPIDVFEQAWPEIAQCFEELEGRLFNVKLENLRTAKDVERVKRARAGRTGAFAKMGVANAKQVPDAPKQVLASAGKCHIGEKRREEESKEEQKPSRRQAASDPKKHSDARYEPCKDLVFAAYRHKNQIDPQWDGREGKALGMLLSSWPQLQVEDFRKALHHWARSEVAHSDRPGIWLPKLGSFLTTPIDRFNKPLENVNGRPNENRPSPAKQRVDGNRRAIAEALAERGIPGPWGSHGAHSEEIPKPGRAGCDAGIPEGSGAVSPEVLPPER
jgi:hypothetical protein